ncbi:unnamed protein product, partial [Mesorhabditis belari]|uniref:GB1/RHD3-type G domain-containing protein n=1 Tax=Mesorhabditis belari TaxID=2138241 RepID=A0AAF3F084_9BILA
MSDNIGRQENLEMQRLFDIGDDGKTVFDQHLLNSLCIQIGERPVSIISTAGKSRQGKTFWLNVLLNGLQRGKARFDDHETIGGPGCIQFKAGLTRHTRGIMVWPKVFHRKGKFGKEIAVILMDTQGTFDLHSEIGNAAVIFAISLLMSSVQIFNTKSQIDAQDLDALNTFITFCQRADGRVGQNFLIMVRDAIRAGPDNEYIEELKAQSQQAPKLRMLLTGVLDSFEKVECFMVPRPAEPVIRASGEVPVKDCGSDFLSVLCDCANHVLDNLVPKNVMGTILTGETLKEHVESLVNHVTHNHHHAIGSAYLATSQLYFQKARITAESFFNEQHEQLIRENSHHPIQPELYAEELKRISNEAVKIYLVSPFFGTAAEKRSRFNDFAKGLQDRCLEKTENNENRYRDIRLAEAVNGSYSVYEQGMRLGIEALVNPDDPALITERHNQANTEAMSYFEKAVSEFSKETQLVETKRTLLSNMIKVKFEGLTRENGARNLERKGKEIFEKLLEEHIGNLRECISTTTSDEQISVNLQRCAEKLQTRYETKRLELTLEVMNTLPTVSPQTISQILDNNRQAFTTPFKKCEDDFVSEVRGKLRMEQLMDKIGKMEQLRVNEKQRFGALQAETEAKFEQMRSALEEEQRRRATAESNRENNEAMLLLMNHMKESDVRQREQYDQERQADAIREERRHQEAQEKVDRVWQQRVSEENEQRREYQERLDQMEREQRERQLWNERQQQTQDQQRRVLENQPTHEDPEPNGARPISQVVYFGYRILHSLGF